ncbi:MAG: hypothetical protein IJP18_05140 [Oscillospiraceae bacterium]|nr:hypothetical protein [Oscillospiraceae bacterium]MBQ9981935.1 hypothetical protein [Oscillospiraceae bacterium]
MLYRELIFLKKDVKKYILAFFMLGVVIGYFIYKGMDSSILLFFSISMPGIVIALQATQSSVMYEKNNGMFEKLLTVYKLPNILMAKSFVSFIISAIGLIVCSSSVALIINFSKNIAISSDVFLCQLLIAICINLTLSLLLVILCTCVNQIIVVNGCVLLIMMIMSAICYNIVKAESIVVYTTICCLAILAVGVVLAICMKFIKYSVVIK